ncbi:Na-translocating system protein MpsC family protein [Alkalihalobacterium alkalicellulosilyticum]|uniref:Na-translocating system protein MpsC family protein n=1 Tax=Alkalihalobacterium alkalicellulosilyticum TaxID=1912214 RepID=UPI001116751E|nr:Na-translocating system protein MpsC family protein [Bacillus alkalicellulosilyticus]
MEDDLLKIQKNISAYTGKMFREYFGKGPESVYTSLGYTILTIYLRNFLTPSEKVLLEQDQIMTIQQMRDTLMNSISPELKAYIEILTGKKIREIYYDWNFHNRSAMITCISSEPFTPKEKLNEQFVGKEIVDQWIISLSQQAQKPPEELYSCELNERTIVIIRNGILVRIEKELIRLGYGDLLRKVKRNLEKTYLHNNLYEKSVKRQIVDSFVDWDWDLDKSVIVLFLNPVKQRKQSTDDIDIE